MGGVFICYRRADTGEITGRLYDRLVDRIDKDRVFKDVFSIELGHDFDEVIGKALQKTDVLLVVMGDRWDVARLSKADDPVRREIERAIALNVRIIPLFVRGMKMPSQDELPESLHSFVRFNGMSLREDPDFDNDVQRLLRSIAPTKQQRLLKIGLPVGAALAAAGAGIAWMVDRSDQGGKVEPATTKSVTATKPLEVRVTERMPPLGHDTLRGEHCIDLRQRSWRAHAVSFSARPSAGRYLALPRQQDSSRSATGACTSTCRDSAWSDFD